MAFLIDSMVIGVAGFIILVRHRRSVAQLQHIDHEQSDSDPGTDRGRLLVGFFFLLVIPYMLYYGIMNGSKRGQTLGKMALNIVVRDARTGGPIGFWRGVGRYAITVVFYVVLFIPYLIDNLSPLWDMRRQAWHDKVVHSVVVDRNP